MSEILDQDLAEKSKRPKRKRYFHLLWILFVFLVGKTFQTMHWPGASVLLITSMALMAGFFCAEATDFQRNKLQLSILFLLSTGLVVYYLVTTYNPKALLIVAVPVFVIAFGGFLIPIVKEKGRNKGKDPWSA